MSDCRFEQYFLHDTPETTFGDETLWNLLDVFTVHGQWHGNVGEHIERTYMHEASEDVEQTGILYCIAVYHAKNSAEAGFPSLKLEQNKG